MKRPCVAAFAVALLPLASLALARPAAAAGLPAPTPAPFFALAVPAPLAAAPAAAPAPVCPAAPAADLFMPKPSARSCFHCEAPLYSTPGYTGTGSNCTAALTSLRNQAMSFASTDCRNRDLDAVCNFTIRPDACTQVSPGGNFQETGYATYGCALNIC